MITIYDIEDYVDDLVELDNGDYSFSIDFYTGEHEETYDRAWTVRVEFAEYLLGSEYEAYEVESDHDTVWGYIRKVKRHGKDMY